MKWDGGRWPIGQSARKSRESESGRAGRSFSARPFWAERPWDRWGTACWSGHAVGSRRSAVGRRKGTIQKQFERFVAW